MRTSRSKARPAWAPTARPEPAVAARGETAVTGSRRTGTRRTGCPMPEQLLVEALLVLGGGARCGLGWHLPARERRLLDRPDGPRACQASGRRSRRPRRPRRLRSAGRCGAAPTRGARSGARSRPPRCRGRGTASRRGWKPVVTGRPQRVGPRRPLAQPVWSAMPFWMISLPTQTRRRGRSRRRGWSSRCSAGPRPATRSWRPRARTRSLAISGARSRPKATVLVTQARKPTSASRVSSMPAVLGGGCCPRQEVERWPGVELIHGVESRRASSTSVGIGVGSGVVTWWWAEQSWSAGSWSLAGDDILQACACRGGADHGPRLPTATIADDAGPSSSSISSRSSPRRVVDARRGGSYSPRPTMQRDTWIRSRTHGSNLWTPGGNLISGWHRPAREKRTSKYSSPLAPGRRQPPRPHHRGRVGLFATTEWNATTPAVARRAGVSVDTIRVRRKSTLFMAIVDVAIVERRRGPPMSERSNFALLGEGNRLRRIRAGVRYVISCARCRSCAPREAARSDAVAEEQLALRPGPPIIAVGWRSSWVGSRRRDRRRCTR